MADWQFWLLIVVLLWIGWQMGSVVKRLNFLVQHSASQEDTYDVLADIRDADAQRIRRELRKERA